MNLLAGTAPVANVFEILAHHKNYALSNRPIKKASNILKFVSLFVVSVQTTRLWIFNYFHSIWLFCSDCKWTRQRLIDNEKILKCYRVSLKKGTLVIFCLISVLEVRFTFSHVFQNQNFEPVSSSYSKSIHSETVLKTLKTHART